MQTRFPGLVIIQAFLAIAIGVTAAVFLAQLDRAVITVVLAILLTLFAFVAIGLVRAITLARRMRPSRGGGPRGGEMTGVREPRRPRPPGFPSRAATLDPPAG